MESIVANGKIVRWAEEVVLGHPTLLRNPEADERQTERLLALLLSQATQPTDVEVALAAFLASHEHITMLDVARLLVYSIDLEKLTCISQKPVAKPDIITTSDFRHALAEALTALPPTFPTDSTIDA